MEINNGTKVESIPKSMLITLKEVTDKNERVYVYDQYLFFLKDLKNKGKIDDIKIEKFKIDCANLINNK